ncbi:hypothetical protein ABIA32_006017 [Streptacidiphilus sp. MAP12-20]|uniref:hypothetical protein n=1 Tax=Streptacidiphilus sp. MAP12-20 TaxID=3156299 RepID=UPI003511EB58
MKVHLCARDHSQEIPAATGSVLCAPCIKQVERTLRMLPSLHRECLHHIAPTPRRLNPTKVSGSRRRDHLNASALDARHNLLTILESWSEVVAQELGAVTPARSVPQLARFLTLNLQWLAAQPPAADFADEIEGLRLECLRAIDAESGAATTPARECFMDGCTGTVSASSRSIQESGASSITCSSGHSWEMHEWITLRQLMKQQRKVVA